MREGPRGDGYDPLRRLRIEEDGLATDPLTQQRIRFNIRAISIVEELRKDPSLHRIVNVYAELYRLDARTAHQEIQEFLDQLRELKLLTTADPN